MLAEALALAAAGLFFGSFFGAVAARVPEGRSIVAPPSACPACGHRLGPLDLIPVVSFLLLRRRCRYCGALIPWRYLLIELATGAAFALAHWISGAHWPLTLAGTVFLSFLVVLSAIDLERMLLPDKLTMPGIAAGLALAAAGVGYVPWQDAALGAAVGYGLLRLVRVLTRGAMGGGDAKLLALIGAFVGPMDMLRALFFASLIGSLVGLSLMAAGRHQRRQPLPFGPFLAAGAVLALILAQRF